MTTHSKGFGHVEPAHLLEESEIIRVMALVEHVLAGIHRNTQHIVWARARIHCPGEHGVDNATQLHHIADIKGLELPLIGAGLCIPECS